MRRTRRRRPGSSACPRPAGSSRDAHASLSNRARNSRCRRRTADFGRRSLRGGARAHRCSTIRTLNAFLAVARDRALERARAIDRDKHAGPLAGVPIARQGQHHDARHPDDRRVEDAAHVRSAVRRDRRRTARGGRRRRDGQDQLRRIRDGIVDRELRIRAIAQSVEPGSHLGRLQRRIGRRRRRRLLADRARLRHRRLHPAACVALRHRRPEADLRARLAIRVDRVRVLARSDWADDAHGATTPPSRCPSSPAPIRSIRQLAANRAPTTPARSPATSAACASACPARCWSRAWRQPCSRLLLRRARNPARARSASSSTSSCPHAPLCDLHVLRDRDRRSELEPRALRRRAVRVPRRRARAICARCTKKREARGLVPK